MQVFQCKQCLKYVTDVIFDTQKGVCVSCNMKNSGFKFCIVCNRKKRLDQFSKFDTTNSKGYRSKGYKNICKRCVADGKRKKKNDRN